MRFEDQVYMKVLEKIAAGQRANMTDDGASGATKGSNEFAGMHARSEDAKAPTTIAAANEAANAEAERGLAQQAGVNHAEQLRNWAGDKANQAVAGLGSLKDRILGAFDLSGDMAEHAGKNAVIPGVASADANQRTGDTIAALLTPSTAASNAATQQAMEHLQTAPAVPATPADTSHGASILDLLSQHDPKNLEVPSENAIADLGFLGRAGLDEVGHMGPSAAEHAAPALAGALEHADPNSILALLAATTGLGATKMFKDKANAASSKAAETAAALAKSRAGEAAAKKSVSALTAAQGKGGALSKLLMKYGL